MHALRDVLDAFFNPHSFTLALPDVCKTMSALPGYCLSYDHRTALRLAVGFGGVVLCLVTAAVALTMERR